MKTMSGRMYRDLTAATVVTNSHTTSIGRDVAVLAIPTIWRNGWRLRGQQLVEVAAPAVGWFGVLLGLGLVLVHLIFH